MNMNISPVAMQLINAIEGYEKESCKKEYRFELEEELRLRREIEILQKHLDLLADYELKKGTGSND